MSNSKGEDALQAGEERPTLRIPPVSCLCGYNCTSPIGHYAAASTGKEAYVISTFNKAPTLNAYRVFLSPNIVVCLHSRLHQSIVFLADFLIIVLKQLSPREITGAIM